MRTQITTTIDGDLKEKVMPIIQNDMKSSVSAVLEDAFNKILNEHKKE